MYIKTRRALLILLCIVLCAALGPSAFASDDGPAASPVTLLFYCSDDSVLPGLHVVDEAGIEQLPATDAETGSVQYGRYLLMPGSYSYYFHDESGQYEDVENSLILEEALTRIIPLQLTPVVEIQHFQYTYINPAYVDVVTEEDIPLPDIDEEAQLEELLALTASVNGTRNSSTAAFYSNSGTVHTTAKSAGAELKKQILKFDKSVVIRIKVTGEVSDAKFNSLCNSTYNYAVAHTGVPTEGDYLHYEFGGYNATGSISYTSSSDTSVVIITFTPLYYTTSAQEATLTKTVNSILSSLALDGKSDYQKILAIYNYLTANVKYGGSGDTQYTAYAALVNKLAVCQGYSAAFYRLCLSAGVDARIISSASINHAWNIAALGGKYYELDATWDAGKAVSKYLYFLRGSTYWEENHSGIGDQFNSSLFKSNHPLSTYDFKDLLSIPVNSTPSTLKAAVLNLDDIRAELAAQVSGGASGIDQFTITLVTKPAASLGTDSCSYDVNVSVAAYKGTARRAETLVDLTQLNPNSKYTFSLSVPDLWAGRQISYTRSGGGFANDTGTLTASAESSVTFNSIAHLGRFVLTPVKYTVSFNTAGGSSVEAQTVVNGDKAVKPSDPTRAGYWFAGWYKDQAFNTAYDFDTAVSADTTVYAKWAAPDLVLPGALTEIGEEAFADGVFSFVCLPDQAVAIGPLAFARCGNLKYIYIPAKVTSIDPTAFAGVTGLTVYGESASAAEDFARDCGFVFIPVKASLPSA